MEPRQIYVGSLSRRERSWGRARRARRLLAGWVAGPVTASALLAAGVVLSGLRF